MIVDSHTHILPLEITKNISKYSKTDSTLNELFNPKTRTSTAEALINSMDERGIEISVVMGMGWTDHSLNQYVNDYLLESATKYPERLIPLTGIIPCGESKGIYEAERCVQKGAKGIGEIHTTNQGIDLGEYSLMKPFMQLVDSKNLPVVIHCSEPVGHKYSGKGITYPDTVEKFVSNFPESEIVLAHWGGGLPFYLLMPEVDNAFSNVYFDTAATNLLYDPRIFQVVEKICGPQKILFGSDYPLVNPNVILKQIDRAGFDPLTKRQIKSLTALKLFG